MKKYERNQGIRHLHFKENGFEGDWMERTKDNIRVETFEDEDCLDKFLAYVDGVKWGWVKDTDQLTLLLSGKPRE